MRNNVETRRKQSSVSTYRQTLYTPASARTRTHTHTRTNTHTHTHVENRETRTEQRKAVGETPQELQSSPSVLLVYQREHSAQCNVL